MYLWHYQTILFSTSIYPRICARCQHIAGIASIDQLTGISLTGFEINFFVWEPAGDLQKNLGRQFINFGRQLILYTTYTKTQFYMLLCIQEKSQLKSKNNSKQ